MWNLWLWLLINEMLYFSLNLLRVNGLEETCGICAGKKKYSNVTNESFGKTCGISSWKEKFTKIGPFVIMFISKEALKRQFMMERSTQMIDFLIKGLIILATARGVLADFWVPNVIDSLNFQHMLLFWFREVSQNLGLFRQLFFHSYQGGTKGKMLKKQCIVMAIFQHFSFGPPLETMKKKVV